MMDGEGVGDVEQGAEGNENEVKTARAREREWEGCGSRRDDR